MAKKMSGSFEDTTKSKKTIAKVPINHTNEIQVNHVVRTDDTEHYDVRNWFQSMQTGEIAPGKGVFLKAEHAYEVAQAIIKHYEGGK